MPIVDSSRIVGTVLLDDEDMDLQEELFRILDALNAESSTRRNLATSP